MRSHNLVFSTIFFISQGVSLFSAPLTLNFELPLTPFAQILNYYDTPAGGNLGVTINNVGIYTPLNVPGGPLIYFASRGGLGDPNSQTGALTSFGGTDIVLNFESGFTGTVSLFYASIRSPGVVSVYDGFGGTGTSLASLAISPNVILPGCPDLNAGFCPFTEIQVSFAGTGKSLVLSGLENSIIFDDITVNTVDPVSEVPEPATFGLVACALVFGICAYRRKSTSLALLLLLPALPVMYAATINTSSGVHIDLANGYQFDCSQMGASHSECADPLGYASATGTASFLTLNAQASANASGTSASSRADTDDKLTIVGGSGVGKLSFFVELTSSGLGGYAFARIGTNNSICNERLTNEQIFLCHNLMGEMDFTFGVPISLTLSALAGTLNPATVTWSPSASAAVNVGAFVIRDSAGHSLRDYRIVSESGTEYSVESGITMPEPSSATLFIAGLALIKLSRARRKRSKLPFRTNMKELY